MAHKVETTGVPTIVVLVSGRPMTCTDTVNDSDAFVAAWLPGSEGDGVAQVLFGDYDFTGKLPYSWPSSMDQVPVNIGDTNYSPLFPYGYGLNYKRVPSTIEAEDYSASDGVNNEACTDTGYGSNVAYIESGDWMDYNVTVPTSGTYNVEYRVASTNGLGSIELKNGSIGLSTTSVPNTGDWQSWTTVSTTVNLNVGTQTLRLNANTGGFNINWLKLTPVTQSASTKIVAIKSMANDKYVCAAEAGESSLVAKSAAVDTWEKFEMTEVGNGLVTLKFLLNNEYVTADNSGLVALIANKTTADTWEKFLIVNTSDGKIALKAVSNGKYICAENSGNDPLMPRSSAVDTWEKFEITAQ